jgi:hypothetical protein
MQFPLDEETKKKEKSVGWIQYLILSRSIQKHLKS